MCFLVLVRLVSSCWLEDWRRNCLSCGGECRRLWYCNGVGREDGYILFTFSYLFTSSVTHFLCFPLFLLLVLLIVSIIAPKCLIGLISFFIYFSPLTLTLSPGLVSSSTCLFRPKNVDSMLAKIRVGLKAVSYTHLTLPTKLEV